MSIFNIFKKKEKTVVKEDILKEPNSDDEKTTNLRDIHKVVDIGANEFMEDMKKSQDDFMKDLLGDK